MFKECSVTHGVYLNYAAQVFLATIADKDEEKLQEDLGIYPANLEQVCTVDQTGVLLTNANVPCLISSTHSIQFQHCSIRGTSVISLRTIHCLKVVVHEVAEKGCVKSPGIFSEKKPAQSC